MGRWGGARDAQCRERLQPAVFDDAVLQALRHERQRGEQARGLEHHFVVLRPEGVRRDRHRVGPAHQPNDVDVPEGVG